MILALVIAVIGIVGSYICLNEGIKTGRKRELNRIKQIGVDKFLEGEMGLESDREFNTPLPDNTVSHKGAGNIMLRYFPEFGVYKVIEKKGGLVKYVDLKPDRDGYWKLNTPDFSKFYCYETEAEAKKAKDKVIKLMFGKEIYTDI